MSELLPMGASLGPPLGPPPGLESKAGLATLRRLQEWVGEQYKQLSASLHSDVSNCQFVRIMKTSPHPVLVTQPSLSLVCRVDPQMQISCLVQSFNMITIKEIYAAFEGEKVFSIDKFVLSSLFFCDLVGRA